MTEFKLKLRENRPATIEEHRQLRDRLAEARTLILAADVLIPALGELAMHTESWRKDAKKFLVTAHED